MKKLLMILAFALSLSSVGMARERADVVYRPARPVAVRAYDAPARVEVHRSRVVRREWRRDRRCWR